MLTEQQRQSLGELLHGSIIKHNFYAMRERPPLPQPTLDMVPTYTMCSSARTYTKLYEMCRGNSPEVVFKSSADTVRFPRTGNTELIFKYLDGKRSLKEIFKRVMSDKGKGNFISLLDEFKVMYAAMNHPHNTSDWVMLHHASLPAYPTLEDLQQNIKGLTTT